MSAEQELAGDAAGAAGGDGPVPGELTALRELNEELVQELLRLHAQVQEADGVDGAGGPSQLEQLAELGKGLADELEQAHRRIEEVHPSHRRGCSASACEPPPPPPPPGRRRDRAVEPAPAAACAPGSWPDSVRNSFEQRAPGGSRNRPCVLRSRN